MHRNYEVIGGVALGIWGDMYSVLRGKGVSGGRGNPARMPKGASERAAARFNTTICRKHRKQRSREKNGISSWFDSVFQGTIRYKS